MAHTNDRSSLKFLARTAIVFLAAGAMSLSSVADGFARSLGGGGRGMSGDGVGAPGGGGRFPGNDGSRYPGGGGPRFPGGGGGAIMLPPPGYGPGNAVVIVDEEGRSKKAAKQQQRQKQQQQQLVRRGGFKAPPPGERRFVPNEVLLKISAATSAPALEAIARRHRLTRLETQDFTLTRRRLARLRINDGRPVATVIRALQTDGRILGAQPNYLYAVHQSGTPAARTDPPQNAPPHLKVSQ